MTIHAVTQPRSDAARRDLDTMDYERLAKGLVTFHPPLHAIKPLLDEAGTHEWDDLPAPSTLLSVAA